jgi:hypothetical protein
MSHLLRDADGHLLRDTSGHLMRSYAELELFDDTRHWKNTCWVTDPPPSSHTDAGDRLLSDFEYGIPLDPGDPPMGWINTSGAIANMWNTSYAYCDAALRVLPVPTLTGRYIFGLRAYKYDYRRSGSGAAMLGIDTGLADGPVTTEYADLGALGSVDVSGWTDFEYTTWTFSSPILVSDYLYIYMFFDNHHPATTANQTSTFDWGDTVPIYIIY